MDKIFASIQKTEAFTYEPLTTTSANKNATETCKSMRNNLIRRKLQILADSRKMNANGITYCYENK